MALVMDIVFNWLPQWIQQTSRRWYRWFSWKYWQFQRRLRLRRVEFRQRYLRQHPHWRRQRHFRSGGDSANNGEGHNGNDNGGHNGDTGRKKGWLRKLRFRSRKQKQLPNVDGSDSGHHDNIAGGGSSVIAVGSSHNGDSGIKKGWLRKLRFSSRKQKQLPNVDGNDSGHHDNIAGGGSSVTDESRRQNGVSGSKKGWLRKLRLSFRKQKQLPNVGGSGEGGS